MKHTTKTVHLRGLIYGPIWQPGFECCWKPIILGPQQRYSTAVHMARRAIGGFGDFQHAKLAADAQFVFERETTITDDDGRIVTRLTRTRYVPVTAFPSIADLVGAKDRCELDLDEEAA